MSPLCFMQHFPAVQHFIPCTLVMILNLDVGQVETISPNPFYLLSPFRWMLLMASPPAMDTVTDSRPTVHQNGTAHRESSDTRPASPVLRLHFYYSSQGAADSGTLSYPPGDYVAEELCIDAAKACCEYSKLCRPA